MLPHSIAREDVPCDQLNLDSENARLHGDRNLAAIRSSIERFGFVEPLVVSRRTMTVLGGNARLTVAREIGLRSVPVSFVDLNEKEERALALALNRVGELSEWNYSVVAEHLKDIEGFEGLTDASGWSHDEVDALTANLDTLLASMDDKDRALENTRPETVTLKLKTRGIPKSRVQAEVAGFIVQTWPDGEVELA